MALVLKLSHLTVSGNVFTDILLQGFHADGFTCNDNLLQILTFDGSLINYTISCIFDRATL